MSVTQTKLTNQTPIATDLLLIADVFILLYMFMLSVSTVSNNLIAYNIQKYKRYKNEAIKIIIKQ